MVALSFQVCYCWTECIVEFVDPAMNVAPAPVIFRIANENRITAGKDPMGMAASALYIACVDQNANVS
jgi:hypothetical protein